jgi:hypothetical protein
LGKQALTALSVLTTLLAASNAQAVPITITATGIIIANAGRPDTAFLFGASIDSLIGSTYTETIMTDPSLNSAEIISTPTFNSTMGGSAESGPGSPFTISVTLNGTTFTDGIRAFFQPLVSAISAAAQFHGPNRSRGPIQRVRHCVRFVCIVVYPRFQPEHSIFTES